MVSSKIKILALHHHYQSKGELNKQRKKLKIKIYIFINFIGKSSKLTKFFIDFFMLANFLYILKLKQKKK